LINTVEFTDQVEKQLKKLPKHIVINFQNWVEDVEERGLFETRKTPSYHDEPLKGKLKGLRSIRLSKAYRAYYKIVHGSVQFVQFIQVERIDKHEY